LLHGSIKSLNKRWKEVEFGEFKWGREMQMDYLDFKALLEELGITDKKFIGPLYSQLTNVDGFGGDGVEFAASVIKSVAPNDPLMVMQAAQMAVMHWATMQYMRQVADKRGTEQQELAVNTATKLARTFSAQLDALKRYRTGGEQKVTVQHVSVNRGGRAAFVTQRLEKPRKNSLKKQDQPPALTDSRQVKMPSLEGEKKAWLEYVRTKK
jgi:hypothetical protein